ncbi:hypothetical protein KY284_001942 [Solanum tuberosum]|nr:hypothetical protein KY284_001942 [Solanum tuberosum]
MTTSLDKKQGERLTIQKIKDNNGNRLEGNKDVGEADVKYYKNLFTAENVTEDQTVLEVVRRSINNNDNADLNAIPTLREIKDSVYSIDSDSAAGPDGLNGKFYQTAWSIIAEDLYKAVVYFFQGANLPKFFTHTYVVLLPKVEAPQDFKDFRPISLCNVSC